MSNTANICDLMAKYSTSTPKGAKEVNPNRVTVGNIFLQPTGGKGKPFNYSYCYFGISDTSGKFVAGFSMSNMAMLEAVKCGSLSDDFVVAFQEYATKFGDDHVVLK